MNDYSVHHLLRAVVLSFAGLLLGVGLLAAEFHRAVDRATTWPAT